MTGQGDDRLLELAGPVVSEPRRRLPLVVAVGAVVATLVALVLLPAGDDVDVSVDETTTSTTTGDREAPDPGSFPAPIALGGPTDGTESIGLPVKAEPATGLVDGQTVTVTGTGFPPGVSVGVVMCAKEAGRDHGARGASACNLGRFAQAESDADGVVTVEFSVRRLVVLDGQELDCASEPGRCLIGMGMISDYDTSGGVLVDFDPSVPLPDPPAASAEPSTGLADGQEVVVRVEGLVPGSPLGISQCDAAGMGCIEPAPTEATAGPDGTAEVRATVWRAFAVPMWDATRATPNVDCAAEACVLNVWGEASGGRAIPPVPLGFDDGPLDRSPLFVDVRSAGPYRIGDAIEVVVGPLPRHASVELGLCGPELCGAGPTDVREVDGGVQATMRVPGPEGGLTCDGACRLVVNVWSPPGSGPPVLLPDPPIVQIQR